MINVTLSQGDTCTYHVKAACGLPTIQPSNTFGFDIEIIDYDDLDIGTIGTGYTVPTQKLEAITKPINQSVWNQVYQSYQSPN